MRTRDTKIERCLHRGSTYVQVPHGAQGVGFVKKSTLFMTNSKALAEALEGSCEGRRRHVHLINGGAREARIYPRKLASAILAGIREELRRRGELNELYGPTAGPVPDGVGNTPTEQFLAEDFTTEESTWVGTALDGDKVLAARQEGMKWALNYVVVDEQVCWAETRKKPIKWVDRNKGDGSPPNYRSCAVVREVKKATAPPAESEPFSAMPRLEALKALCSIVCSKRESRAGKNYKMQLINVSRAHFWLSGGCSRICLKVENRRDMCIPSSIHVWDVGCKQQMASNVHQSSERQRDQQGTGWPALYYHAEKDHRFPAQRF